MQYLLLDTAIVEGMLSMMTADIKLHATRNYYMLNLSTMDTALAIVMNIVPHTHIIIKQPNQTPQKAWRACEQ
jgi:hypothetical protein